MRPDHSTKDNIKYYMNVSLNTKRIRQLDWPRGSACSALQTSNMQFDTSIRFDVVSRVYIDVTPTGSKQASTGGGAATSFPLSFSLMFP